MKGFIKIDYTAKTEDGEVFDTTSEKVAKDNDIHVENHKFLPKVIKVGEHHLLRGLDAHLEKLGVGKHKVILPPEEAFGKKSASLLKLIPTRVLKEHKIQPFVGQPLDIDGQRGIVRVASGGRTIVDFNHPYAGKNIEYDLEIIGEVTDLKEQAEGILKLLTINHEGVDSVDKKLTVWFKEKLPDEFIKMLTSELEKVLDAKVAIKFKSEPKQ
jgi:FKBP-type peptidyl-prolyl cis-trans isomerase 2